MIDTIKAEIQKIIIGQENLVDNLLIGLIISKNYSLMACTLPLTFCIIVQGSDQGVHP